MNGSPLGRISCLRVPEDGANAIVVALMVVVATTAVTPDSAMGRTWFLTAKVSFD